MTICLNHCRSEALRSPIALRAPLGTILFVDDLIAYHEARAKGGGGMSRLEATSVHAAAPGLSLSLLLIPAYQPSHQPLVDRLAERELGCY